MLAIATVVAAESTQRETFPKLLGASAVTVVLYWIAHAYAHHWGSRLQDPQGWTFKDIGVALVQESSILGGALIPVAALASAWLAGASKETGVTVVLWCAVIEVVVLEVIIGVRGHLRAPEIAIQSVVGIGLGVGILALRILLH